jgi:tyrosinase
VDRYISPTLNVPVPSEVYEHDRVDLELHGVDHSAGSYSVRVFLNSPEADATTPINGNSQYAGSFYIFGHGPCLGDEGHCDIRTGPINPYDLRPAHPLTPQYHRLPITSALRQLRDGTTFTATLVVVANRAGYYEAADLLAFQRLSVVAYS